MKTKLTAVCGLWELVSWQWPTRGPTLMVRTAVLTSNCAGIGQERANPTWARHSPDLPKAYGREPALSCCRTRANVLPICFPRLAVLHHFSTYPLPGRQAHHLRACLAWVADRSATRRRADGCARSVSRHSGGRRQVLMVGSDRTIL